MSTDGRYGMLIPKLEERRSNIDEKAENFLADLKAHKSVRPNNAGTKAPCIK